MPGAENIGNRCTKFSVALFALGNHLVSHRRHEPVPDYRDCASVCNRE